MNLFRLGFFSIVVIVCSTGLTAAENTGQPLPYSKGIIDDQLAEIAYSGEETLQYDVFYSGGIKIGEIHLRVEKIPDCTNCFTISSLITSSGGVVHKLYPIEDRHVTYVKGRERLPYFCEIWQKQGRSYTAHKTVSFDQRSFVVRKQKEDEPERVFQLDGEVHNEFSSFFSSRVMPFTNGARFTVPTFGDDAKNVVVVEILGEEILKDTLFGRQKTVKVTPILTFSGLYDKRGDTIVWYTANECRVPVQITSEIVIGSLTAKLAAFKNPKCKRYESVTDG